MYGYGYDIHIASLMAIAKLMIEVKGYWSGTLICLIQPNEEGGTGVQAMVDDGLMTECPCQTLSSTNILTISVQVSYSLHLVSS